MICAKRYPNQLISFLEKFSRYYLSRPAYISLDQFLSCFILTTQELKTPHRRLPHYFVKAPLMLICFVATLPFMLTGFVIWFLLVLPFIKAPYEYSATKSVFEYSALKKEYSIATANVCLLCECISRINNLSNNTWRAKEIAKSITSLNKKYANFASGDGSRAQTQSDNCVSYVNKNCDNHKGDKQRSVWSESDKIPSNGCLPQSKTSADFNHDIVTEFPDLDFICFQEVWDRTSSDIFVKELQKSFPYIISNVGVYGVCSNMFLYSSGLCFASKYPILEADFKCFPDSCAQCRLASKGALFVKVLLGRRDGQEVVGFITCTHMQAYQGNSVVLTKQLDKLNFWVDEWREKYTYSGEVVAFDLLGGDLNFDNMSPVHIPEYTHPIFNKYVDVCRVRPGLDHEWAVGTDRRHIPMWDTRISSPSRLKSALEDPELLQYYVVNADLKQFTVKEVCLQMPKRDEEGNFILSPVGGKRRIDYLMYRDGSIREVKRFNFVTQLCLLTDHIPLCMTFSPKLS